MASPRCEIHSLILCILLLIIRSTHAASFNESCRAGDPPCHALIAYRVASTSIANISSLFFVTPQDILAANGFPPEADVYAPLVNETLKIMLPCPCSVGQRAGNIIYNVVAGDWLSRIAEKYGGLVTYQEIANASNVLNPNQIAAGQNLTIPYPCSCRDDILLGRNTIFMSYVVQEGESVGVFAREYGVSVSQLTALNPGLKFEQGNVIRLPVASCKANFSSDAADANLTVALGSYITTANGCVQCSCNGTDLYCTKSPLAPATCELRCQNSTLEIGNRSTGLFQRSGCRVDSCLYDGYSNTSNRVFTKIKTYTTNVPCQDVAGAPPEFAYAPEEQGVPEAAGGPSSTPAAGGPSSTPAAGGPSSTPVPGSPPPKTNTPSTVTTAPPPQSASTMTSFGVHSLALIMLALLVAG